MLPDLALPASLMTLLAAFEPLFTAPSFHTFCALAAGFLAQTGRRTVCGMLAGAGLSAVWRHDWAHRFFSCARWNAEALGLALTRLTVTLLVPDGDPVLVAIDDTLFKRTGPKVHAIGWFHDGSAQGPHPVGMGNNWVIAAIVVRLPFLTRRRRHQRPRGCAAYAGKELRRLPDNVTWTTRLRQDAEIPYLNCYLAQRGRDHADRRRAARRGGPGSHRRGIPRPGGGLRARSSTRVRGRRPALHHPAGSGRGVRAVSRTGDEGGGQR